jgi:uncharacterized protein (TIGR02145 family)
LAPYGWKIPSIIEWNILADFLGGADKAGTKLKMDYGWYSDKYGTSGASGTNSSGFSGLPGGYRDNSGSFVFIGQYCDWWNSTDYSTSSAHGVFLSYNSSAVIRIGYDKPYGFSVRCLRD